jgi:hypothetical protein
MSGSTVIIHCKCDNCGIENKSQFREYYSYTSALKEKYYCNKCNKIKFKKTLLSKYGVDNPMKIYSVKQKLKNSLLDKYGVDHFSKTDEYKEKYKKTCNIRYGYDNASKHISVKKIISDKKFNQHNSIDKYRDLLTDDYHIIKYTNNRNFLIKHKSCNYESEIFIGTLYDRIRSNNIICTNCNPIDTLTSSGENEIKEYLRSIGVDFIENNYSIINPLSLDIYIPSFSLAIEYNGVYWHSELYRDNNYHLNKTLSCSDKGIDLLHIWEDDWLLKKDIVKSMLLNRFGKSNRIWARNCVLKEVNDIKIVRNFLNRNHIQGYASSSYKIGLYHNDELVSLMCLGKKRKDMELIRFCSKLETIVVGGASKLFKFFLDKYKYEKVVSFSDISGFSGNMYDKLGFKNISNTRPNYWWVVDGVRKHRFNYNKSRLLSKFEVDSDKSESEIMNSIGYNKIWGCGLKKWVYEN